MEGSMNLSITRAWDETAPFVKQEAGALFLIIFALGVLPNLIFQAIVGRIVGPMDLGPGGKPNLAALGGALPYILLTIIPIIVLSLWGNLTVTLLALRRETVIGSAFGHAARRLLPLLAATLLFAVCATLVVLPLIGVAAVSVGSRGFGLAALIFLLLALLGIFVGIRLMLMTPAAAAEPLGPIAIIRRSWQLTSGHFWKLFGFFLLLIVVFFVVFVAVGSVLGVVLTLTAGRPEPGSLAAFLVQLVTGIVQAVWTTYFVVLIARIYAQLAGDAASVAEVFD